MSTRNRIGNKWSVNEVLSLQREYELLEWDIDQIAEKHGRTANAIMYKLDQEGFADYNDLYSNYNNLNGKMSTTRTQKAVSLEPSLSDDDTVDDDQDEDYEDDCEEEDEDDESDEDEDPLTERVAKLESGLDEIKDILKALTSSMSCNYGIKKFY